jgi:hypothetical protein
MAATTKFSPMVLDRAKDAPAFVNDEGTKWWAIDVGDPLFGQSFLAETLSGEVSYIVIKGSGPVYLTGGLEQLCCWFTMQELLEGKS